MSANSASLSASFEAMNAGDPGLISKTIDEFVDANARIRTPLPLPLSGADVMQYVFATLRRAYPDIHLTVEDLIAGGDKVVSRNSVRGTHRDECLGIPPTCRSVTYDEIFVFRFVDGRIAETWGVADVLTQMRQVGARDSTQSCVATWSNERSDGTRDL